MKRLGTFLLLACIVHIGFQSAGYAQGRTELLRPAPITPVTGGSTSVFVAPRQTIAAFKPNPIQTGTSEALSYYDQTGIAAGQYFPLITPRDSVSSFQNDNTHYFTIMGYAERFSTNVLQNAPQIRLDSVKIYLYVDSMPAVNNNGLYIEILADTLGQTQSGDEYPFPSYSQNGGRLTSKFIPYSQLKIGGGQLNTLVVKFSAYALKRTDFCVLVNALAFPSTTSGFIYNAITAVGDSIDQGGAITIDPSVNRNYWMAYLDAQSVDASNQAGSFYWEPGFNLYSDGSTFGYAPEMYMIAYVRDPSLNGVNDAPLTGNVLAQNFPNPFNPSTEIRYSIADHGNVTLKVYNSLGIEVKSLVDGVQDAGEHSVNFYGDDMPTGTYYYTLKTGSFSETKRMVLTK
jgi:hypothetical protein